MARKPKTLSWNVVQNDNGKTLGSYAVDVDLIVVKSAITGEEKTTQLGGSAAHPEALARLILSEADMRG